MLFHFVKSDDNRANWCFNIPPIKGDFGPPLSLFVQSIILVRFQFKYLPVRPSIIVNTLIDMYPRTRGVIQIKQMAPVSKIKTNMIIPKTMRQNPIHLLDSVLNGMKEMFKPVKMSVKMVI